VLFRKHFVDSILIVLRGELEAGFSRDLHNLCNGPLTTTLGDGLELLLKGRRSFGLHQKLPDFFGRHR
jgi:hypothetical protein